MRNSMMPLTVSILIVINDAEQAVMYERILSLSGYHVLVARNAESALVLLADYPADLLVTDAHLSGMSGIELIHETRKRSFPIKTVLLHLGDGAYRLAREAGADGWMEKMSGLKVLLKIVQTVLGFSPTPGRAGYSDLHA